MAALRHSSCCTEAGQMAAAVCCEAIRSPFSQTSARKTICRMAQIQEASPAICFGIFAVQVACVFKFLQCHLMSGSSASRCGESAADSPKASSLHETSGNLLQSHHTEKGSASEGGTMC